MCKKTFIKLTLTFLLYLLILFIFGFETKAKTITKKTIPQTIVIPIQNGNMDFNKINLFLPSSGILSLYFNIFCSLYTFKFLS